MTELGSQLQTYGTVLLDGSGSESPESYLYANPVDVLKASRPAEIPALLESLDEALERGLYAAGYLAYEAGYALEDGVFTSVVDVDYGRRLGYPLAWFGLYESRERPEPGQIDKVFSRFDESSAALDIAPDDTESAYLSRVDAIRELIREGDLYQVNLTGRFRAKTELDQFALYGLMRKRQPVAYAAFVQLGDVQLLSSSPERFVEWGGGKIAAQPMKGTAPRGSTDQQDDMLVDWLRTDVKSRAENLMIVDLLRNDLSVVCEPGSVDVPSLFDVERFPTVLQMTSTVTGRLPARQNASGVLRALFPCGSVTGAPKIRAMRRILELESGPRGIYCGAIGHLSPGGHAAFSVAIRTLSHKNGNVVLGSGGGIVWDSDSLEERSEALLKTEFLSRAIDANREPVSIIETMKWSNGIDLFDRHMDRLQRTASEMGYGFSIESVLHAVENAERSFEPGTRRAVRLLLGPGGETSVTSRELKKAPSEPIQVGLSTLRVHSGNPFLRVKTTFRPDFERAQREARDRGLDEVILLNERGELTEGTITNVFLLIDGTWFTPPLSSGLLPGVGREIELVSGRATVEKALFARDFYRAQKIVLTNAVRGRMEAVREGDQAG